MNISALIVKTPELTSRMGLSTSTLNRWVNGGEFPQKKKLTPSGRAVGWLESDINEWFHQQLGVPLALCPTARIYRLRTVIEECKISKSEIYRQIEEGVFPKQIELSSSGRAVGWLAHEIEECMKNREYALKPCPSLASGKLA